jgi:hypothetical protein
VITMTRRMRARNASSHSVYVRPYLGSAPPLAPLPWSDAGPGWKGMDPSNPMTYVRPWNPQGGMISYLNFDGAQAQARTPTGGVQRGRNKRRRVRQG